MTPLLLAGVVAGAVVLLALAERSPATLLGMVAGGVVVVGAVAAHRVGMAGRAVHQEFEGTLAEDLGAIANAVAALDKVVHWSSDQLCRGERPPISEDDGPYRPGPVGQIEKQLAELKLQIVDGLIRVHDEAQASIFRQAVLNMAKRQHTLVTRALTALSALEGLTEDPFLLNTIFSIDHLVTRVRRHGESVALIGGQSLRAVWHPVSVVAVLRGAASEVEKYTRVSVVAGAVGRKVGLPGHVGPNLTHLLAELIENALECSPAETMVMVRLQQVKVGLAIEVEDRGISMPAEAREVNNALLRAPEAMELHSRVAGGQIGLVTAALIAQKYGMTVDLRENSLGGTTALVVVPENCLVDLPTDGDARSTEPTSPPARPTTGPRSDTRPRSGGPSTARQPAPGSAVTAASATTPEHSSRLTPATAAAHGPTSLAAGTTSEAPVLPRRQRNPGSFRPPADAPLPAAPAPGVAAAFFRGSQAGASGEHNT
ncbi:ATP-binding protein [Streptomyces sp. NPDC001009]